MLNRNCEYINNSSIEDIHIWIFDRVGWCKAPTFNSALERKMYSMHGGETFDTETTQPTLHKSIYINNHHWNSFLSRRTINNSIYISCSHRSVLLLACKNFAIRCGNLTLSEGATCLSTRDRRIYWFQRKRDFSAGYKWFYVDTAF
jgi:hypothetical protein